MKTIKDIILWGRNFLKNKGVESFSLDTDLIISSILGREKSFLYAHPEFEPSNEQIGRIKKLITLRGHRFPVSYLLNSKEFYGLEFYIERGVFTPRPETEILVSNLLDTINAEYKNRNVKMFEIGLGSGAISVVVGLNAVNATIYGCDVSKKAISISKKNILRYNLGDRVHIIRSFDFDAVKEASFDIIVSNPPYLSLNDYLSAEKEVRKEPRKALIARDRGLFLIKKIIREGRRFLKNQRGFIFIEIGDGQGEELKNYSLKFGLEAEIIKDYADKERVLKISVGY